MGQPNATNPIQTASTEPSSRFLSNPQMFFGLDFDLSLIIGFEFNLGIYMDSDRSEPDGIYLGGGLANGASAGAAVVMVYAFRGVAGETTNVDINLNVTTPTISFDRDGFSGWAIGSGAGVGYVVSETNAYAIPWPVARAVASVIVSSSLR